METSSSLRRMQTIIKTPHSLGKLVEWKLLNSAKMTRLALSTPHSLGKLVEWKRDGFGRLEIVSQLPTRWGN